MKQRLVGAIVLVALGVIFIPMLLEGPDATLVPKLEDMPEFTESRSGELLSSIPSSETPPEEPERSVLLQDTVQEPPAPAEDAVAPEAEPEATAPREEAQAPVVSAVEPASERAAAKPGPLGSWVVQVGSFSSQQNALALRNKLRKGGFSTQVEKVQVEGKTHYRVRVGPFLERSEADRNQRELRDKFSLTARVLSYP